VIQGATVVVGVCTAMITVRLWDSRRRGERTDHRRLILVAAGVVLLGWAGYWGLLAA